VPADDGPDDRDDELQARLHERGLRLTPQRQLVLEAVERLGHATPEAICAEVQKSASGVNLSTVYRALEVLEEVGLVRHAHLGSGPPAYHAAHDHAHLHLVCSDCGAVQEADVALADELVGRLAERYAFTTDVEHMAITGRCAHCAARAGSGAHG
jgi:Fur family ferric uptake transcriptional regulator